MFELSLRNEFECGAGRYELDLFIIQRAYLRLQFFGYGPLSVHTPKGCQKQYQKERDQGTMRENASQVHIVRLNSMGRD